MASDPINTARLKEIFLSARDIPDSVRRAEYLVEACGGDETLRRRVEGMLAADEDADGFLDPPPALDAKEPSAKIGDSVGYFGDYLLLDEIARGASGVVFRARQVTLDRVVALKMLRDRPELASEADAQRLRVEAAATAALDHPHIVPIYEIGVHEGQPFLSMKFIEGGTLQFRMAEFRADPRRAVALMAKVARAAHHAHSHGILHRDLKPGNILIDNDGEPRVVDFGLARKMDAESDLTKAGQIMGTPNYMAPEQARGGARRLTPGADIYSLGAVLYELLGGRRVFEAADLIELLRMLVESDPTPLKFPDKNLSAVVMKCLRNDSAERYGTAEELAADLESWLATGAVKARSEGALSRTIRRVRRRPWLWAGGAAGVAAAAMAAVSLANRDRTRPSAPASPPARLLVTTLADELDPTGVAGTGVSLREAVRDAPDGAEIEIDPRLVTADARLDLAPKLGKSPVSPR